MFFKTKLSSFKLNYLYY